MRRAALAGGLIVLLLGALFAAAPFLTRDRDLLSATPQPSPLNAVAAVGLRGGEQACLDQAVIDERSEQARFSVGTFGRRPPPLRLTIRGRGYAETARIGSADYRDSEPLAVGLRAPAAALAVRICIRNEGRRTIALSASNDRTQSRSATTVDGRRVPANIVIAFAERRPASLLEHVPVMLRRMTAFRPVGEWLLWPLAILFALGVPAGVMAAYGRSASAVDAEDGRAAAVAGTWPPGHTPLRDGHPTLARIGSMPGVWLAAIVGAIFLTGIGFAFSLVDYVAMPQELAIVKQASQLASALGGGAPGDLWPSSPARLWPLLLTPAYGLLSTPVAFHVAHLLAAAAIASAAIPAYLLAGRVVDDVVARLFAAALTVAVPWLAFSGSVLGESLAYPLVVWALLACTIAIERPSAGREALALGVIALAFLTRPQLAGLAVAFALAALMHELTFGRRTQTPVLTRVRRHAVLLAACAAGLVIVVAGVSSQTLLGDYARAADGPLIVGGMLSRGGELLAYVGLGVAVLPLALAPAWIVLELLQPRRAAAHAFAVLSLATAVTMVVVASSASVRFGAEISDRHLFYVVPLLTIGTVALLFDRRPATLALSVGGVLAAAILATAALADAGASAAAPTHALNTVVRGRGAQLIEALGLPGLAPADLLAVVTVAAVVALALARHRHPGTRWIAIGTCSALLLVCVLATRYTLGTIKATQAGASQETIDGREWLDRSAPGSEGVGAVLSSIGEPAATAAAWWNLSFWNARLDRVWRLPGASTFSQRFTRVAPVDPRTGRIPALDDRSLLVLGRSDRRFALRGERIVGANGPFSLVRAARPYRAAWTLLAARDDGLLAAGGRAQLTLFGDGRREQRVRVRLSAGATPGMTTDRRLVVRGDSGREWTALVPGRGRAVLRATVRVPAVGRTRLALTLRGPAGRGRSAGATIRVAVSPRG